MRGNGRVFQRGSIWWVAYYDNGREHRESSGSRDRKDAVRRLRQRLGEMAAGALHAPQRPGWVVLMRELFDMAEQHYRLNNRLTPTNRSCPGRLRRRFRVYTVQGCMGVAISHYMADRLRRAHPGDGEPRHERAAGRLPSGLPARPGDEASGHQEAAGVDGAQRVFHPRGNRRVVAPCLPEYLRDVVLFGYLTGWRKGEITGLNWRNVDRTGAVIRLEPVQNKGRAVRVLTLQGELAECRWQAREVVTGQRSASFQAASGQRHGQAVGVGT